MIHVSKYTTELRYVCEMYAGLTESTDRSGVENVITNALPKIFDFDFPIFDENYRAILERKIVYHYYTRELGYETVGLWKLKLQTKLQEIMPYYNKLYESELIEFNPIYTQDITKDKNYSRAHTSNTSDNNTRTLNTTKNRTIDHDITIDDTAHNNNSGTDYRLHSDTPQGGLDGVDTEQYLSDAEKLIKSGNGTNSNHHTDLMSGNDNERETGTIGDVRTIGENANTVDEYLEHIYGYGGYSPSKLLQEYRDTLLNIDMMIIKDLSKLFMGLW